jgi:hypothetical protein
MLFRAALALILALVTGPLARAEILPTLPLRELTIRADAIVLAEPLDSRRPGRFRVNQLLKGAAPAPGAELDLDGLERYIRPQEQIEWAGVDAALLFLRLADDGRLEVVETGVRLHTRDRKVWWPVQPVNPGGYRMVPETGVDWDVVLVSVRSDAGEVVRLRRACEVPDATRRDPWLLDWVERHRNQFTDGRDSGGAWFAPALGTFNPEDADTADLQTPGWGELQLLPFARVLQGRVPADCWRAVNLYADVFAGATPPGAAAAFTGPEGRAWLLAAARDRHELDGRRARALRLLADPAIAAEPPDLTERSALVEKLLPLLRDAHAKCRGLAARAIRQAAGRDPDLVERALPSVRSAYKAEEPGPARNDLAEVLYDLAGPERWAKLAGRPNAILSLLVDATIRDDKLYFWVTVKSEPPVTVTAPPTLYLQRLDAKGAIAETKKVRVTLVATPKGTVWNGSPLHVEVSQTELRPGTWRYKVSGVAGTDKRPWESEPRTLRVAISGPARARPQRSVWGGLLQAVTGMPDLTDEVVIAPENKSKRTVELDGEAF